jgi:hypothetical protein
LSLKSFLAVLSWALAAAPPLYPAAPGAEELYHEALVAYLDGRYDKAILLSARSLEKDPAYPKARNLLTILTSETEMEGKTVIWLAEKGPPAAPVLQAAQADAAGEGLGLEVYALREKVHRFYDSQMGKNAELSGRMQVVQGLVKNNYDAQYSEIRKSQIEIYRRLESLKTERGAGLWPLYLLCLASAIFSILAYSRGKPKK